MEGTSNTFWPSPVFIFPRGWRFSAVSRLISLIGLKDVMLLFLWYFSIGSLFSPISLFAYGRSFYCVLFIFFIDFFVEKNVFLFSLLDSLYFLLTYSSPLVKLCLSMSFSVVTLSLFWKSQYLVSLRVSVVLLVSIYIVLSLLCLVTFYCMWAKYF